METKDIGTTTFAGSKYSYKKLDPDKFRNACVFEMVGEDRYVRYMVFTPQDGEIKTPNDGRLCAICPDGPSALMVAASICIASEVAGITKRPSIVESEAAAKASGFDTDRIRAEVFRLRREGKSFVEISEEMERRSDEFKVKRNGQSAKEKEGGEW